MSISPGARPNIVHRTLAWPVHRPVPALIIAVIVVIVAALATSRLRTESSLDAMFSSHDPAAGAMTRVLDDFAAVDELIVLVSLPKDQSDSSLLLNFAERLEKQIDASPSLTPMTAGVVYKADPQMQAFFRNVLAPAGMYYLDADAFNAARQRLTQQGIAGQIQRDESMISTPGPAAEALSKVLLQDPLALHEFLLDRMAGQQAFKTRAGSDALLSPSGQSLLIRIKGRRPPSDLEFAKALTDGVAAASDRVNSDHLKVEFTGAYAIAAASERAIRHDMIWSVIGSVIGLHLLFLLAYRRAFLLFALAFGPVAMGILLGFGICAMLSLRLTPMTAVLGTILAGMGIDYSIQYLSCYERRRCGGAPPREAAERGINDIATAIVAAWATSIIGFLAIGWSSVRALREFALLGMIGLTGAFACVILLMPALLALTDRRPSVMSPAATRLRLDMTPLLRLLTRFRKICIAVAILLLLSAAGVIAYFGRPLLPLESDLTVMHPRPNSALLAQDHIVQQFGSAPGALLVYLHADSPEALITLAHRVNDRLSSSAVKSSGVVGTFGLATLLPDPQIAASRKAAIDPAEAECIVTDFRAAIAASMFDPGKFESYADFLQKLLNNRNPPTLPDLLDYPALAEMILPRRAAGIPSADPSASHVTEAITLVFVHGTLEDRASRDAAVTGIRKALADTPGAILTGLSVLGYDAETTVGRDLPRFLLVAAILTLAYLLLHFRHGLAALLALLPAVFSMVCLVAVLRLFGQKLNMVNLIALPLLIGIDVDYGIFIVSLAKNWRGKNAADGALEKAQRGSADRIASSSQAVLICAVATFFGFGSLAFTSVPAIRSLGIAVGIGILACVVGCFLLLVPLLPRRRERRSRLSPEPDSAPTSPASKCAL